MASNYSPAVIPTEADFSDYAVRTSTTILAVVGQTPKGPVDTPTLVNSEQELIDVFGNPTFALKDDFADGVDRLFSSNIITDCIQYLREGNQLMVVRVVGGSATKAAYLLPDADATSLTLTAVNEGAWANDFNIIVSDATNGDGNYYDITIRDDSGQTPEDGVILEVFQNLASQSVSGDDTNKPEERINGVSSLFTVKEASGESRPVNGTISAPTTVGADDAPGLADVQGGVNLLRDTERYTVNLIAMPQSGSPTEANGLADKTEWNQAINTAITMCEYRGECMVLVDPYYSDVIGQTASQAKIALNNGTSGNYDFDSSQCALYGPWLRVYDGYNRKSVWVAPSCVIAGQYAYNDRVSYAWFAPAGPNRGKLRLVSDVSVVFERPDLESLQAPRMITNPIRPIINEGITIWGQRTGQRKATALNRVNARRMLNSAKHTIATATRVLLFEPNDDDTWIRFRNLVNPIMQYIKDTRGVYDFRVICDASTNPPSQIDQNIMRGKILLKPTKTAETIYVDFSVLNTGANFDEFV